MTTGSVLAQFTITISQAVSEQVAVEWHTADGTALAGVDYAAAKGAVLFAPGQTANTVDILVHGRAVGSEDRSFFVEMLPPTNAILGASIGECIIHVDTTGSTPVTQIIVPTGPRGLQGDSAYQAWLDLGNTGTEQDFIDSLKPSAAEIAQEVAPLIDLSNSPLTAEGTETLSKPDTITGKRLARRVAYVGAAKVATVLLADGDNLITHAALSGDSVDFNSISLYPRILRGAVVISPEWSVEPGDKILIKSAVAGDVLHVCQYDVISERAVKNVVEPLVSAALAPVGSQAFEALRRSYAEVGHNVVGTFQGGFTYVNANDVGIDEATGKGFTGPTGPVAAGTDPLGGGFVNVSESISRPFDISLYGGINATLNALGAAYVYDDVTLSTDVILSSGQELKTVGYAVVTLGGHDIKTEGTETLPFYYYADSAMSPVLTLASPVSKGGSTLTLTNAASVQPGDLLWIQNGYCDFWRYFEDLAIPEVNKIYWIDTPLYFGEHVRVLSVAGNVVTLQSGTRFAYSLSPVLTGSLANENSLPEYAGFNSANVRRATVKDVSITGKFDFSSGGRIFSDGVDGLSLDIDVYGYSASESFSPRSFKQTRFDKCLVNSRGVNKAAVLLQQCSGSKVTGQSYSWLGGSDAPYTTMLHSQNDIEDVVLEAVPSAGALGAAYINAGGNGRINNVRSTNSRSVALCSFSKGVYAHGLTGINVDVAVNGYISVDCSCKDAVLTGYYSLTSATPSSSSVLSINRSLRFHGLNIIRENDLGYGLLKIDELTSGAKLDSITAPATDFYVNIAAKGAEYAVGLKNDKVSCTNMRIKNFLRTGGYFDAVLPNGLNYPVVKFDGIVYGNAAIGANIVRDEYDIFVWGNVTVGGGSTVRISGTINGTLSPATTASSFTCFIDAKDLRVYGAVSGFQAAPVNGLSWFPKGMCMTDFTTMKRWWHSGSFGAPGQMVQ